MAKNIVVFSDGTGQEGGRGESSNVYRLFNLVEDRTPHQVAFYDRGLGTGWRKVTGQGAGMGISQNILECYQFIFEQYQAGDTVYLFGFSRGAYTVRSLSGFIELFGILPSSRPELIKAAYKIYKITDEKRRAKKLQEFKSFHSTMTCPIQMIGVWDTVGALGIPIKFFDLLNPFSNGFHKTNLASNVRSGFHALSIDDERKTFHPTLWNERSCLSDQKIEQVWFPGVHTDIGGGYTERGLSNMSLNWMIKKAAAQGLRFYPQYPAVFSENPDEKINNSRRGLGKLYAKKLRSLKASEHLLPPRVHPSVFTRKNYQPWVLKLNPIVIEE